MSEQQYDDDREDHAPPEPGLLLTFANANLAWWKVLGEWIDNAFDAKAKTISFDIDKKSIRISDDGNGAPNLKAFVSLGGHVRHTSTRLGRYGIGSKHAALWVASEASSIHVRSVHAGRVAMLSVNWLEFARRDWHFKKVSYVPAQPHDRGTVIDITSDKSIRELPRQPKFGELIEQLGYLYAPALRQGLQIKITRQNRTVTVAGWQPPPFDGDVVNATVMVAGRSVKITCGVVHPDIANPRAGFTYYHAWRVIEPSSANGCGNYNASHICGWVEVNNEWPLTTLKDGLGGDRDALFAAVEEVCREVLKRGDAVTSSLRSHQFESAINERLQGMLANQIAKATAKAKRHPGIEHGTKEPTNTDRQHRRAKNEQPGSRFPSSTTSGGLTIGYTRLGTPHRVGEFKRPSQILLNTDNEWVTQLRRDENADAILAIAVSLIVFEHARSPEDQPLLRGFDRLLSPEEFSEQAGRLLSSLVFNGKPVIRAVS